MVSSRGHIIMVMKWPCRALSLITLTLVLIAPQALHAQGYQVIHHFEPSLDGSRPNSLARDAAGNFFGTTEEGGPLGLGIVFKVDATTHVLTILHNFSGSPDGTFPLAPVILDSAGNLYGTTHRGGEKSEGTVFKVDPAGIETVLHSFDFRSDGARPFGALTRDPAGNLYGTAAGGGHGSSGVVFRINKVGTERMLYQFSGLDGASPHASLARDLAGNLYGTTYAGGAYNRGTVFKLSPGGAEIVLHSFTGGTDGDTPYAEPILDSSGNLYSTTSGGGDFGSGTVFKVDSSGIFTVMHSFTGADGGDPEAGLIRDPAGNLYGTTKLGGDFNRGVVFKIDLSGNETVLHSFAGGSDGEFPDATLLLTSDGTIFGSTSGGSPGSGTGGTLFKLKP